MVCKNNEKQQISLSQIITLIIIFIGIFVFLLLSISTLLVTTSVSVTGDQPLEINLNVWPPVIGVAILITVLLLKPVKKILQKIDPKKLAWVVFLWGLIMSILWIFIANVSPAWDSQDLSEAADCIVQHVTGGDDVVACHKWEPGSYMQRYPYQIPITLIIVLCKLIAGDNFVILFEILNCFACAFGLFLTVKLTHKLFNRRSATTLAGLFSILFLPIVLYCTFIYGNVLCIPFILLCWYLQKCAIDCLDKNISIRNRQVLLTITCSILCGGIAVVLKSSMVVGVIASAIVWAMWGLQRPSWKQKALFAGVTILTLLCSKILITPVNTVLSHITDVDYVNNNVPSVVWVAMGVGGGLEYQADQTGDESIRNSVVSAGYYDGLPWAGTAEEYSSTYMNSLGWTYLVKRLQHYADDPGLAINYFTQKLLIEWTEPTFEGLLASNWDAMMPNGYNMSQRNYTPLAKSFYYGKVNTIIMFLMDVMQTVLVIGILLALVIDRKKLSLVQMVPIIYVLGIFILYIFWENKTQYLFPAYLFMIPFAGLGWSKMLQKNKV